jgi:hypothetical protein
MFVHRGHVITQISRNALTPCESSYSTTILKQTPGKNIGIRRRLNAARVLQFKAFKHRTQTNTAPNKPGQKQLLNPQLASARLTNVDDRSSGTAWKTA